VWRSRRREQQGQAISTARRRRVPGARRGSNDADNDRSRSMSPSPTTHGCTSPAIPQPRRRRAIPSTAADHPFARVLERAAVAGRLGLERGATPAASRCTSAARATCPKPRGFPGGQV
jgi:hypothetical protein